MHWENPRTKEPFTPLPLPKVEVVNKFFENYSKDVLLPLDFLIVRVHQLLLEYGESKSSTGQYLKILNRFRWFCFKKMKTILITIFLNNMLNMKKNY